MSLPNPYFISRKILPKRENVRAKKLDILYDKTTGGSSPVPSRSQPLRIFNLTQSCVFVYVYGFFMQTLY